MTEASRKSKKESLVTGAAPVSDATAKRQDAAKKRRDERNSAYVRNKRQLRIMKIASLVVVLAVVAVAGYGIYNRASSGTDIPDGVKTYTYAGGQHDDSFTAWTEVPPAGGIHNNTWQKCGFYSAPIMPGMGVHDMEHGAVWITYDASKATQDELDQLKALAEGQDKITVSPYAGLPTPFVLSSWNHQLQLDKFDMKTINQYIKAFKNNTKYTPEPGATCSNGSTATV